MIKKHLITTCLAVILPLSGVLAVMLPYAVSAKSCGGAETSVIECGSTGKDAIIDIIKLVIKIMSAGVGILAVGATIVGGILYSSAGGSPENIKKATEIWTNTVIGLILFATMVTITNFLVPGGVFG